MKFAIKQHKEIKQLWKENFKLLIWLLKSKLV
jgi:hypothetical protein